MLTVMFKITVLGMMALEMPAKKIFEPIFGPDPISMTARAPEQKTPSEPESAALAMAEDEPMLMDLALGASQAHAQQQPPAGAAPANTGAQQGTPFNGDTLNTEEDLTRRRQELKELEKSLDAKLARLQKLEAKLSRMLEEAKELQKSKLKHLIDVYKNMKAKQAASVIETLDTDISVKILAGMPGRQAGEILSYVKPTVAAKLTELLTVMQVQ